jgi:hypothetical protein
MAKETGLGDNFYVGSFDLSGDTQAVDTISSAQSPLDKTGINRLGFERITGLRSGNVSWKSHFNPSVGFEHDALSALPTTDVIASYFHKPAAVGNPSASLVAKQIDYKGSRDSKGDLIFSVDAQSNRYATEWGIGLTPGILIQGSAGAGTAVNDVAATTNFGLQAYLHVFAFTGTSASIVIQASSDNGAGDAYTTVTGATFTSVTAPTSERIQTANNVAVEKWLRVLTTGTFTVLQFAINCNRNNVLTSF